MTRALVLSGGGTVGIAWQTGLAAGLATKGVDLREADLVVGTSAGSAVGARLALGRDMVEATEEIRRQPIARPSDPAASPDPGEAVGAEMAERMAALVQVMSESAASSEPFESRMAAIGAVALAVDAVPEEAFVSFFADLAGEPFPDGFRCTAVDAHHGEFRVWEASSGVALDRAVASSCAVPGIFAPITIDGRRYLDGGMRSVTNADLAVGHDTVLIVTLAGRIARGPENALTTRMREQEEHEHSVLRDGGAQVETIGPDDDAAAAMGVNLMDPQLVPAAAEAGFRQGQATAASIAELWG